MQHGMIHFLEQVVFSALEPGGPRGVSRSRGGPNEQLKAVGGGGEAFGGHRKDSLHQWLESLSGYPVLHGGGARSRGLGLIS